MQTSAQRDKANMLISAATEPRKKCKESKTYRRTGGLADDPNQKTAEMRSISAELNRSAAADASSHYASDSRQSARHEAKPPPAATLALQGNRWKSFVDSDVEPCHKCDNRYLLSSLSRFDGARSSHRERTRFIAASPFAAPEGRHAACSMQHARAQRTCDVRGTTPHTSVHGTRTLCERVGVCVIVAEGRTYRSCSGRMRWGVIRGDSSIATDCNQRTTMTQVSSIARGNDVPPILQRR